MSKTKILFVCLGNICRSACAEAVMKQVVDGRGLAADFEIDSAGLISYHTGEKADPRMRQHAANRGINITSIARKITTADFSHFDYIIGMDDDNIRRLLDIAPDEQSRLKISKMSDYCRTYRANSVPDPYYGGPKDFELVLDLLDDACNGLLETLGISD
ncbi:MAG: low molecular weight phosphotyrosine protein phosphatase [Salinivirgaceae bacterium]|nr:low molecular weight phosphotyrosine protein phosphatase [Salinivirgaceae bacterium]